MIKANEFTGSTDFISADFNVVLPDKQSLRSGSIDKSVNAHSTILKKLISEEKSITIVIIVIAINQSKNSLISEPIYNVYVSTS